MRFMMIVRTMAPGREDWSVRYVGEIPLQSRQDAMEWIRRFPSPPVDEKELLELDDLEPRCREAA